MDNRQEPVIRFAKILAVITIVLFIGTNYFVYSNFTRAEDFYPIPEKIMVYYDGETTELTKKDEEFLKFFSLNTLPKNRDIEETSIDPDGIAECKEMAVEFVYEEEETLLLNQEKRNVTKLLFVYSGWCEKSVIFYNDGEYQSGTLSHNISERKFKKTYKKYIGG